MIRTRWRIGWTWALESEALALSSGASFADAAHLANFAGGLVVMKRGTATVSSDELFAAIAQVESE